MVVSESEGELSRAGARKVLRGVDEAAAARDIADAVRGVEDSVARGVSKVARGVCTPARPGRRGVL